jgi:hypothetical protein
VEYAAGHLVQHVLGAVYYKGVASVWATLEAAHPLVAGSLYVNKFSFSFVAPLKPKDDVCWPWRLVV